MTDRECELLKFTFQALIDRLDMSADINQKLEVIMVDLTKIKTAVDALQAAAAKGFAEVAKDVQALKDQIAAGDAVTQADLDALADKVQTTATALASLDPVAGN